MSSIFSRLQYNFSDPDNAVKPYDQPVLEHLQSLPPLLENWQFEDIANTDTDGYFVNPVANAINEIISYSNLIASDSNNVTSLNVVETECAVVSNVSQDYLDHTNRISGVTNFESSNGNIDLLVEDKPFLITGLGVGTTLSYLTYQYDGVSNTSTTLGNFTSILVGDTLNNYANQLGDIQQTVNNSISVTMFEKTSNLTSQQISDIETFITDLGNFLQARIDHDENFYTQSLSVLSDYDKVEFFSGPSMGQSKSYLVDNFIGTEKIKQRLNPT
jgi:hypothetical protein